MTSNVISIFSNLFCVSGGDVSVPHRWARFPSGSSSCSVKGRHWQVTGEQEERDRGFLTSLGLAARLWDSSGGVTLPKDLSGGLSYSHSDNYSYSNSPPWRVVTSPLSPSDLATDTAPYYDFSLGASASSIDFSLVLPTPLYIVPSLNSPQLPH